MNWTIIIIETIILTAAFTAMILIPLVKNPVWWIADYPEDIHVGVCSSALSLALSGQDFTHGYCAKTFVHLALKSLTGFGDGGGRDA